MTRSEEAPDSWKILLRSLFDLVLFVIAGVIAVRAAAAGDLLLAGVWTIVAILLREPARQKESSTNG